MPRRTAEENARFAEVRERLPGSVSNTKCWQIVDRHLDYLPIAHPDPVGEKATRRADRRSIIHNEKEGPMDLMTTEEAAAFLHVPLATLRFWIAQDRIRSAKIGRRRMLRRADLERFVNDKFDAA